MIKILNNALIKVKLTEIRDINTTSPIFYQKLTEVAKLMSAYVFEDLKIKEKEIATPVCKTKGYEEDEDILFVVILRAGLGFLEGFRQMLPFAKIGFLGMYRDEVTLEPHNYYKNLPSDLAKYKVYVLDPMLATGGSAIDAIEELKKEGATKINFIGLVGAPEGLNKLSTKYPDVNIYLASLDEKLNEKGYIVPGLGDCGDRIFG